MSRRAARIAACLCLALALLAVPACANAADPFYGIFTTDLDQPPSWQDAALAAQAATGVGTLREHVYWDRIERSPGAFDFSGLDALVDRAGARGLSLLPILTGTPQFYSTRPVGLQNDGWPPTDPSTIFRYSYELAHRYGSLGTYWGCVLPGLFCKRPYRPISAWEVWNEPDYLAWWRTGVSASAYTRLLQWAYLGLKLGDVNGEVVIGGLSLAALLPNGFLEQVYDNGGALFFDTLALHPYAANVGTVLTNIRRARQIADAHQLRRQHHVLQRSEAGQQLEGLEHEAHAASARCGARIFVQRVVHVPGSASKIEKRTVRQS